MFIKNGDGKILSVIDGEDLNEKLKKLAKEHLSSDDKKDSQSKQEKKLES